jgi:hypothetical protein
MLRKLFISLLILSALTSDGIINLTEILCDPSVLTKEIIDIVLAYEGEFTAKQLECLIEKQELKAGSALFSSIKFSNCSFEVFSGRINIKSWILSNLRTIEMVALLSFLFFILFAVLRILTKSILLYRSDLSPPLCIN